VEVEDAARFLDSPTWPVLGVLKEIVCEAFTTLTSAVS